MRAEDRGQCCLHSLTKEQYKEGEGEVERLLWLALNKSTWRLPLRMCDKCIWCMLRVAHINFFVLYSMFRLACIILLIERAQLSCVSMWFVGAIEMLMDFASLKRH